MKHFFKIIPFLTLAFAPLLNATAHTIPLPQAERAHSPLGYWKTADGKAKVHIYNCGEDICGKIIALKEPTDLETGKPKVDPKGTSILNMEIMKGFKQENETHWCEGEIYDPKEGKTYSAEFTVAEEGKKLELRGYVLVSLFGRTQTWVRMAEEELL